MRIRYLAAGSIVCALFGMSQPAHAQRTVRDLQVTAALPLEVVLVPYDEIARLKDVRDDKFANASYTRFMTEYVIGARRFEHRKLSPEGDARFNALFDHNVTLNYVIYFSCEQRFSGNQQRTLQRAPGHPARTVRSFSLENACA